MGTCVVGADVLGGPRACGRSRGRPRGRGAPRTSRPTIWCVVGADVPAARVPVGVLVGVPVTSPWARRAGDVAPYHVVRGRGQYHVCVVGADVPGGPRACGTFSWASP